MSRRSLPQAFKDFPASFRGSQFRPGDAGYAEARRIYNMQPASATPALIARAADADDVVCVMQYASQKAVPVAIRSGGHSSDACAMADGALHTHDTKSAVWSLWRHNNSTFALFHTHVNNMWRFVSPDNLSI